MLCIGITENYVLNANMLVFMLIHTELLSNVSGLGLGLEKNFGPPPRPRPHSFWPRPRPWPHAQRGSGTVQPANVQWTESPLRGWSKVPRSCGIRPNAFCVMSKAFPRKHQNIEISFLSLELFSITFKNILLALLGRRRSLELGPAELFIPH